MNKTGTLFIIAAPSGAGKTSLVGALLRQRDDIAVSVSHTTRPPRPGEVDGDAYHFVAEAEFKALVGQGRFLEHARVFDHYYGTSRDGVRQTLATGKSLILEIDWQGARQVAARQPDCVSIFILPPDYATLRRRLLGRKHDAAKTIERRMGAARDELARYEAFDYIVINDEFERALGEIRAIITAANLGRRRQAAYYDDFVAKIIAQPD